MVSVNVQSSFVSNIRCHLVYCFKAATRFFQLIEHYAYAVIALNTRFVTPCYKFVIFFTIVNARLCNCCCSCLFICLITSIVCDCFVCFQMIFRRESDCDIHFQFSCFSGICAILMMDISWKFSEIENHLLTVGVFLEWLLWPS